MILYCKLEIEVSRGLWNKGIHFRKNDHTLFGKSDISIENTKLSYLLIHVSGMLLKFTATSLKQIKNIGQKNLPGTKNGTRKSLPITQKRAGLLKECGNTK